LSGFRKILVLQTAFAGDLILAAPLARGVKEVFKESEVHFLVIPETAVLLKHNPFVDKVWIYDKKRSEKGIGSFLRLMRKLSKEEFDLAIVPHRSLRSALLVFGARIPRRVGFDRSTGAVFFTDVVPYFKNLHEVERNFKLPQVLGWSGDISPPELFPGAEEREEVDRFFDEAGIKPGENLLAVAPGSVWPTKRWPAERFASVIDESWKKWKIRSVLIGGKSDVTLGQRIVRETGDTIVNAMGRFSLLASAELISRCRVILTNDSAPLHLAIGVGTPVVAIFGPTVPSFGFAPYGNGHTVIEKELECRPCSIHGGKKCPRGHFRCMKDISVEEVTQALKKYFIQ